MTLVGLGIFLACEKEGDVSAPRKIAPSNASCTESQPEKEFLSYAYASTQNKNLLTSTYFTEPEDSLLMLKQIEAVRKTNCSNRSIHNIISTMGYPLWNKANYVDGLNSDSTTYPIIISPLALLEGDTITAVLFGLFKQNAFEFYLFNKKEIMEAYGAGSYTKQDYFSIMSEFQLFDYSLFGKVWEVDTAGYERNEIESRNCVELTYIRCIPFARIRNENPVSSRNFFCPEFYQAVYVTVRRCSSDFGGTLSGGRGGLGDPCFDCDYTGGGGGTRGGGGTGSGSGTDGGPPPPEERDTRIPCQQFIPCEWSFGGIASEQNTFIPPTYCTFTGVVYSLGSSCNFKAFIEPSFEQGCARWKLGTDNSTASYAGAQNLEVRFNGSYSLTATTGVGIGISTPGGTLQGTIYRESEAGSNFRISERYQEVMDECHDCLTWCED